MAVTSLYLYLKNGNDIGGGKPVLTGPSFVDKTQHRHDPPVHQEEHPVGRSLAMTRQVSTTRPPRPAASTPSEPSNRVTRSLSNRVLARPEVGALVAAVIIFIFFLSVAARRSAPASRSSRCSTSRPPSASSPSASAC